MNTRNFKAPIENRYFEDYEAGTVHEFGSLAVEEKGIISFANRFDHRSLEPGPRCGHEHEGGEFSAVSATSVTQVQIQCKCVSTRRDPSDILIP